MLRTARRAKEKANKGEGAEREGEKKKHRYVSQWLFFPLFGTDIGTILI